LNPKNISTKAVSRPLYIYTCEPPLVQHVACCVFIRKMKIVAATVRGSNWQFSRTTCWVHCWLNGVLICICPPSSHRTHLPPPCGLLVDNSPGTPGKLTIWIFT